ncbi:MAG: hypothetical protein ACR2G5_02775 [Pyrinomonadaceae bacterium]
MGELRATNLAFNVRSIERLSRRSQSFSIFVANSTDRYRLENQLLVLPMTQSKKVPEFIETSLIYALSAVAALLGFFLVWLVCTLSGLNGL